MRSLTALGFAILASNALAAPEVAQSASAVVPLGEPPSIAPELVAWSREFDEALQKNGVRSLGEPDKVRLLGFDGASYGELDAAYARGRGKMSAGDYSAAQRELRSVVDGLERLFGWADTFPRWSRAMLHLARVEQLLSRPDEARRTLERLVKADPFASPDPDLFPPSFVGMFDQVRAEVRKRPLTRLVVSTHSPTAAIFLDGREIGAGNATANLPQGVYGVRVVVGDVRLKERKVTLQGREQRLEVDTSLAEALRRQPVAGLVAADGERSRLATELSAVLGVDRLYLVSVSRSAEPYLVAEVVESGSGRTIDKARLRLAKIGPPPGGIAAMAALLAKREPSALLELGILQHVAPPPPVPAQQQRRAEPVPAARPPKPSKLVPCASQLDCAEAGGLCFDGYCRR